jgi:putative SOS response-associated peptidase YedK
MCYQVSLAFDRMALSNHYKIPFEENTEWEPVYFQTGFSFPQWPVLSDYRHTHFSLMRWGLIPQWIADRKKASEIRSHTLNAMSETAAEKPSFRSAMKQFPVVIPVGGFFENRHEGTQKIPYFISGKEEKILSLAGIADEWTDKQTGEIIHSFSILTCKAEGIMSFIHNSKLRSPLVLQPGRWREWLNIERDANDRLELAARADEILQAWKIKPDFNKTRTMRNQEQYLKPWADQGAPPTLF